MKTIDHKTEKYPPLTERKSNGDRTSFLASSQSTNPSKEGKEKKWYVKEINEENAATTSVWLYSFMKQEFLSRLSHAVNPHHPKSKFLTVSPQMEGRSIQLGSSLDLATTGENIKDFSLHYFVQGLCYEYERDYKPSGVKMEDFVRGKKIRNLAQSMLLKVLLCDKDNKLDNFAWKKVGDEVIVIPIDFEHALAAESTIEGEALQEALKSAHNFAETVVSFGCRMYKASQFEHGKEFRDRFGPIFVVMIEEDLRASNKSLPQLCAETLDAMAAVVEVSYAKTVEDVNDPKKGVRQFADKMSQSGDSSFEVDRDLGVLLRKKTQLVERIKTLRESCHESEKGSIPSTKIHVAETNSDRAGGKSGCSGCVVL